MAQDILSKRRDPKHRILRSGESIRADGKYQYKYAVNGKPKFVYSWKLEPTDKLPAGKRPCLSLRELEKQNYGMAKDLLIKAQIQAEAAYLEQEDA